MYTDNVRQKNNQFQFTLKCSCGNFRGVSYTWCDLSIDLRCYYFL